MPYTTPPSVLNTAAPGLPARADAGLAAARELSQIEAEVRGQGGLLRLLSDRYEPGEHYPRGEGGGGGVWDAATHAQFFYHKHPEGGHVPGEHGHFHLFIGQGAAGPGLTPLLLPEMALAPTEAADAEAAGLRHRPAQGADGYVHVVGISLGNDGRPLALFAPNRWVTAETWYRAEDVARLLGGFSFANPGPVEAWLAAFVRYFAPTIGQLLADRDKAVME